MSELLLPLPVFGFYLSSGLGILRPSDLTVMGPAQPITGQGRSWAGSAASGGWGQQFSGWDLRWNTDRGCWIHDTQRDEGRGSTLYIKLCPKHRFWNQKDLGLNLNLATLTPHL